MVTFGMKLILPMVNANLNGMFRTDGGLPQPSAIHYSLGFQTPCSALKESQAIGAGKIMWSGVMSDTSDDAMLAAESTA